METFFKNMEKFVRHWGPGIRRFPASFRLQSLGSIPGKRAWVTHAFGTVNFSLILSGGGEYHARGRCWKVRAPCVIMQWPGEHLRYGPAAPYASWDEIYLIYEASLTEAFRSVGFFREDRPAWRIRQIERVTRTLDSLLDWARAPGSEGTADRVDRLAEQVILETLLGEAAVERDPTACFILGLRDRLREAPALQPDWDREAMQHGCSPSTFRRRWQQIVGVAPTRYLTALRMREAQRLLVETRLPAARIGERVGYPDPLYFSRRFHEQVGLTAREYRQLHQRRDAILMAE